MLVWKKKDKNEKKWKVRRRDPYSSRGKKYLYHVKKKIFTNVQKKNISLKDKVEKVPSNVLRMYSD